MPIYKVTASSSSFGYSPVKLATENGTASSPGGTLIDSSTDGTYFKVELKETSRRSDINGEHSVHRKEATYQNGVGNGFDDSDAAVSIVEREIRIQRQRDAELAALHKSVYITQQQAAIKESNDVKMLANQGKSFSSPADIPTDQTDYNEISQLHQTDRNDFEEDDDEDVAVKRTHPGESLILRELMEQRKREEELRRHWKEMGFDLNNDQGDEDDVDDDGAAVESLRVDDDHENKYEERRNDAQTSLIIGHEVKADHPGLNILTKELTEQRQREEELRRHRKELGIQLVENNNEETAEPTTSFIDTAEKRHHFEQMASPSPTKSPKEISVFSLEQGTSKRATATPVTVTITTDRQSSTTGELSSSISKVRPFEDLEISGETASQFAPKSESPLELEIRQAREREEALRQSRGLPPLNPDYSFREIEIQVTTVRQKDFPDGSGTSSASQPDANSKVSMKRYADSRLHSELRKEKQREVDLLKQGKITTLSEDRIGEPMKYIEKFAEEGVFLPQKLSREHSDLFRRESIEPKAPQPTPAAEIIQNHEVKVSLPEPVSVSPLQAKPASVEIKSPEQPPATSVQHSIPPVFRTFSYPYQTIEAEKTAALPTREARLVSQSRIDEEVEEFRRREQELRMQREMTKTEISLSSPAVANATPKTPELETKETAVIDEGDGLLLSKPSTGDGGSSVSIKHFSSINATPEDVVTVVTVDDGSLSQAPTEVRQRRRLAMILEWEKKIVENTSS